VVSATLGTRLKGRRREKDKVNHHKNPAVLARAIGKATDLVTAVSYEYPDTWAIQTKKNYYLLGDVNGYFGWHDEEGIFSGSTEFTTAEHIALAFAVWLDQIEAN
jgi:hypothetical protein